MRRLLLFAVALVAAVGCSSSSSGGTPHVTATPTGEAGPSASATPIDHATVDTALNEVLKGLRSAASVPAHSTVAAAAARIRRGSADLATASQALIPAPAGVPTAASVPVASQLARVSTLLGEAAKCLDGQVQAKVPNTKPCLPPLRKANAKDATLAHALITLAAYSTQSPKTYESDLVDAIQGR